MAEKTLILGAGMTGLAAGMASGLPILEAADGPGGICSSYYMRPGDSEPLPPDATTERQNAYRFEIGGGHWIFGGDPVVVQFLEGLAEMRRYQRRSSVYFPDTGLYVPYPIQNNLRFLDRDSTIRALEEIARPPGRVRTMAEWLETSFGSTLTEHFFGPFHDLYTAGLHRSIAPQDPFKSPVDLSLVLQGAFNDAPAVGYNTTFLYPRDGLDELARRMAARCQVEYGNRVIGFDPDSRRVLLADGRSRAYDRVLSTLPLNQALAMAGLRVEAREDPHTAVLVLNIGARRGRDCPDDHWLYVPHSDSGFHRVGFYSSVDESFLPRGSVGERVSIYVERAFKGEGERPAHAALEAYGRQVVEELKRWGFITEAEVVHPTWIEVAYTWSWPGSSWQRQAMGTLEAAGIYQVGRYGRWIFQGIADSIRDGFVAGNALRQWT